MASTSAPERPRLKQRYDDQVRVCRKCGADL